jgi:hypothetical protein
MKSQIILLLGILLLGVGVVSAMYSGETYEHTFDGEVINCSIINNTFNLDGLTLNWTGSKAIIETKVNYYPDNFTLSCWINQSIEVAEEVAIVSGGHSHKKVVTIPKNTNQTSVVLTNETNVVNETIDLDDGLIDYENVDGIEKTTQRTGEPVKEKIESFVNNIGNFFESIWNWFKELFK